MSNTFTAAYVRSRNSYTATILEVSGINSQGRTIDDARENLKDAMALYFGVNREQAERELPISGEVVTEMISIPFPHKKSSFSSLSSRQRL